MEEVSSTGYTPAPWKYKAVDNPSGEGYFLVTIEDESRVIARLEMDDGSGGAQHLNALLIEAAPAIHAAAKLVISLATWDKEKAQYTVPAFAVNDLKDAIESVRFP